jgi:predicted regulator of Ras-like GTPase activity (Roadblock/LC7/MglB family)
MAFVLNEPCYQVLKTDLEEFLNNSEASAVMLCDRGGNIILHSGETVNESADLISALVAGAFAATQELAAVLGEEEFTAIFHQGRNTSIFISAVGEEVLLLALFDNSTTAGLVKMYALNAINKIRSVFTDVMTGGNVENADPTATFVINKGPIFAADEPADGPAAGEAPHASAAESEGNEHKPKKKLGKAEHHN